MTYFFPAARAHHAYTMALDFGMKFAKRDGFWTPEGLLTITGAGGYRIEIAEESLGLLEPRVGDWFIENGQGDILLCTGREGGMIQYRNIGSKIKRTGSMGVLCYKSIIQRDGKMFHWPEQEKAEGV
jgi:hypothetical protein